MIKSRRVILVWEVIAVLAIAGAVTPIALPLLDGIIMQHRPNEIVIQLRVVEAGGYSPNLIKVRQGETVRLVIRSMDVTHSFLIPELNIDSGPIKAGETRVIDFTATKAGIFEFRCTIFCSVNHPYMNGKLVVT